jgi:hypothetical protein
VPILWLPHSSPGCLQHAPDEHLLAFIAREGMVPATGLFHALGRPQADHPLPVCGAAAP